MYDDVCLLYFIPFSLSCTETVPLGFSSRPSSATNQTGGMNNLEKIHVFVSQLNIEGIFLN